MLDIKTNEKEILTAWREVVDDKSDTTWVVYGYSNAENSKIYVMTKGDGDLSDMVVNLDPTQIMYAFCRLTSSTVTIPKFVLIYWQGENVPTAIKFACNSHFNEIQRLLKGSHITIHARCDEDIDEKEIITKIGNVAPAKVNVDSEKNDNHKPVGTNYQRIIPQREIIEQERTKFWNKLQEEESKELSVKIANRQAERENLLKQVKADREKNQAPVERPTLPVKPKIEIPKSVHSRQILDEEKEENHAERERKERLKEVNSFSKSTVASRRSLFEQNTAAGQIQKNNKPMTTASNSLNGHKKIELNNEKKSEKVVVVKSDIIETEQVKSNGVKKPEEKFSIESNDLKKEDENLSVNKDSLPIVEEQKKEKVVEESLVNRIKHDEHQYEKSPTKENIKTQKVETKTNDLENEDLSNHHLKDAAILKANNIVNEVVTNARNLLHENIVEEDEPSEEEDEGDEANYSIHQNVESELDDEVACVQETDARDIFSYTVCKYSTLEDILEEAEESFEETQDENTVAEVEYDEHDIDTTDQQITPLHDGQQMSFSENQGLKAVALFDYHANDSTEISFDPDDIITNIDQVDEGWWEGLAPDGTYGLFPANHVQLI